MNQPLRVLSIATLFPDAARPNFGLFVEKSLRALAAQPGIELTIAAPVGLPPFPLSLHRRYRALRDLPGAEPWNGLPTSDDGRAGKERVSSCRSRRCQES